MLKNLFVTISQFNVYSFVVLILLYDNLLAKQRQTTCNSMGNVDSSPSQTATNQAAAFTTGRVSSCLEENSQSPCALKHIWPKPGTSAQKNRKSICYCYPN